MPSRQGQQSHRDNDKDACASMMTKTPLQQKQQCQLEDGNNAIAMRETTLLQIKGNDTIVTRVTSQLNDSKDTCALTTQQCHSHEANNCNCKDGKDTCASTAMVPLQ
jgi:hypothetical protein